MGTQPGQRGVERFLSGSAQRRIDRRGGDPPGRHDRHADCRHRFRLFQSCIGVDVYGRRGRVGIAADGVVGELGPGWTLLFVSIGSFFILGDSGVLSAAMADNVPPQQLGSVMGWRSLLGFGIGSFAPLSFGVVMDTTQSWGTSYAVLACGGGVACLAAGLLWRQHVK